MTADQHIRFTRRKFNALCRDMRAQGKKCASSLSLSLSVSVFTSHFGVCLVLIAGFMLCRVPIDQTEHSSFNFILFCGYSLCVIAGSFDGYEVVGCYYEKEFPTKC